MYGWSMAELLGKDVRELRTAASLPSLTADAARAMEPSGNNYEAEHRRKDGTRFPVEITSRSVELDGKPHYFSIVRDITVRQQLESEVRASEERYRLIAENTSDLIWLYEMAQEGFSYVSPSSLPLLGYRPEELRAQKLVTTLTAASAEKAMLIVREELAAIARSPKARSVTVELDQRHKDGRIVPTEVVVSFVADASGENVRILGVTRDITERKRAREALQKFNTDLEQRVEQRTGELAARNHEIQALLNAIPDTVLLCNERGALISARSVKYPAVAGLVTGESLPNRLPLLDQAILKAIGELHASVAAKREIIVREFEWAIGDEKTVFIEARATPVGAQRTLILLRDITDRKQHDRNVLANLEREKQLSAMKSQFVSVASHEFRTPLAAAVGSLELLERHAAKLTDTKRNELLTRIQRALGRLTAIMDDVLQLSRADSGRVQVKRMDIDLARFVQDIIHDVEMGDRQQHTFVFQPTGELQIVPVDPNLLNHILSNLLGNAVRYAPAGTKVSVKLELDHEAFAITVADEGIGIPEAERGLIFEPFVRGSNVGQIAGTGLGLNIVKRYAELMGGTIGLLPSARGAVFHVRIPFQPPAAS
jgi:PAS domain S-box-containing protein